MVQILDENPGFGASLGRAVGQGAGAGIAKGSDFALQMYMEKKKMQERRDIIAELTGRKPGGSQSMKSSGDSNQEFIDSLPEIEKAMGRELTPQETDAAWDMFTKYKQGPGQSQMQQGNQQRDDFDVAEDLAIAGEHDLSKVYTERAKSKRKEQAAREARSEPELLKMETRIDSREESDMRFDRLESLFSPEKEANFPPALLVGALTKDGELNELALASLSPDAQEAVKLIADEVRGLKDTFGSQITGFEVRRFMARLPSLLNTPEGKRRVLRDLRMMNRAAISADQGVLDIIERYGGSSNMSISKAKSIYRKENADKIKEMREQFVNPDKKVFDSPPDASFYPSGSYMEDEETGQSFVSDGKNWIPQ